MARAVVLLNLSAICAAVAPTPASDSVFRYVGRFDRRETGVRFDRNGFEIQFQVQGVTSVSAQFSQRLTKAYAVGVGASRNPGGSMPDEFLVYVDGHPQPMVQSGCKYCTFHTTGFQNETVTDVVLAVNLSSDAHEIRVMKTSEPEWNDFEPSPNWITFHGLTLDAKNVKAPSAPRRQRRIEFLGDSISAGFCNLCEGPGTGGPGGANTECFALSWPNVICERLGAECSTLAWSGLGLVKNCCGGATTVPKIWTRTVATDKSSQWDFSSWVPDALVVNLGTNDGDAGSTPAYVAAYQDLVHHARSAYGPNLHVFLACGPMSSTYCNSVKETLANATASGIHAHFLDQQAFLNGTFGPACCGHPSAQVDTAMGSSAADLIASTLGWGAETMFLL